MKWYTIASSVLAAAQLLTPVVATATCKTTYASTTTKSVPTSTVTKTSTVRKTATAYATSTETVINTTTFTKTYASKTVTVPTSSGFTPIISASSLPGSSKARRDTVRARKAERNGVKARPREAEGAQASSSAIPRSTSYPHNVGCTTTITRTQTTTTTSTFVIGQYTGVTKTTTTHIPTATAYAACGHDNIISYFHGHSLGDYAADHALGICGTSASGPEPCQSAEDCCAAAQRSGYSGFQFTNYTGASNTCTILAGPITQGSDSWVFYAGNGGGHAWFGNGAYNGGVYAGSHTD